MRHSRKSTTNAVVLFLLISVVVLSGITWATVVTYKLARDENLSQLRFAIWRMEKYLGGILAAEQARPYTDYLPVYAKEPLAVVTEDRLELDVELVLLRSPLSRSRPPHDWMDVHFQVDQQGHFSSPQMLDEALWGSESSVPTSAPWGHVSETLSWLKSVLPVEQLRQRIAKAGVRDRRPGEFAPSGTESMSVQVASRVESGNGPKAPAPQDEFQRRTRSKIASQRSSRPIEECVPEDILEANMSDAFSPQRGLVDLSSPLASMTVWEQPWATFWLESKACGCRKMAFVRAVYRDDPLTVEQAGERAVYQGFIGDWNQLKLELLAEVHDLFPDADLQPVADDVPPEPETSEMEMSTVPVRLTVPAMADGTAVAAWRSVRGVLFVSWAAAATVLVVAGWGVRNLVALTERRMQFAYAVTHELRTPLTTFRLYSDMLSAGLVPEASKQEYLDTLNRESIRLSSLVEGVLEYARLENHKVRLNTVDTDGASLLGGVADVLKKRCDENGIESRAINEIPNGSPIRADVAVINQIAGVLINNACRHARSAEHPLVLLRMGCDEGKLQMDIIDSGQGVSRSDARTIFKPFRRGQGADAAAQGGIGLGLALARNWATLLGGRLELAARHHQDHGGAHFRLTVPTQTPL